jgi:hypothetical protein
MQGRWLLIVDITKRTFPYSVVRTPNRGVCVCVCVCVFFFGGGGAARRTHAGAASPSGHVRAGGLPRRLDEGGHGVQALRHMSITRTRDCTHHRGPSATLPYTGSRGRTHSQKVDGRAAHGRACVHGQPYLLVHLGNVGRVVVPEHGAQHKHERHEHAVHHLSGRRGAPTTPCTSMAAGRSRVRPRLVVVVVVGEGGEQVRRFPARRRTKQADSGQLTPPQQGSARTGAHAGWARARAKQAHWWIRGEGEGEGGGRRVATYVGLPNACKADDGPGAQVRPRATVQVVQ